MQRLTIAISITGDDAAFGVPPAVLAERIGVVETLA
jgi:hypothetical protein